MHSTRKFFLGLLRGGTSIFLAIASLSCDDSLPTYQPPTDFIAGKVENIPIPDVGYTYIESGNDLNAIPVSITTASQVFYIDVINRYEETLQDTPEISGNLEITDNGDQRVKATIPITISNITGTQYNRTTNMLTMDPGDTIKFRCTWRYKSDSTRWAFEKTDVDNEVHLGYYFIRTHKPETYTASARIKLFHSSGTVALEKTQFTLVYIGKILTPP